jgi:hypothetical protein
MPSRTHSCQTVTLHHPDVNTFELSWKKENKETDLYWKLTFRMKGVIKFYEAKYSEMVVQEWSPIRRHVKKMEEKLMESRGGSTSPRSRPQPTLRTIRSPVCPERKTLPDDYIFSLIRN